MIVDVIHEKNGVKPECSSVMARKYTCSVVFRFRKEHKLVKQTHFTLTFAIPIRSCTGGASMQYDMAAEPFDLS